jgi:hypothetical protein
MPVVQVRQPVPEHVNNGIFIDALREQREALVAHHLLIHPDESLEDLFARVQGQMPPPQEPYEMPEDRHAAAARYVLGQLQVLLQLAQPLEALLLPDEMVFPPDVVQAPEQPAVLPEAVPDPVADQAPAMAVPVVIPVQDVPVPAPGTCPCDC